MVGQLKWKLKIPKDKHPTSEEVAVFQKIRELREKANSVSLFFFEGGGLYRQKKRTSCGAVTVS